MYESFMIALGFLDEKLYLLTDILLRKLKNINVVIKKCRGSISTHCEIQATTKEICIKKSAKK